MKKQEIVPDEPVQTLEYAGLSSIANEEAAQHEAIQEEQDQAQAQEAAAEQESNVDGWRQAVSHAASMITAMIPEATPVWNGARVDALAEALAKCDEAYGWGGVGGLFSHPLIGLGFASFPLVVGTAKAISAAKARQAVDVETTPVPPAGDAMGQSLEPEPA